MKTVEEVRAMNYSAFAEWIDSGPYMLEDVLDYSDFTVVSYRGYYFYYDHEVEADSCDFFEVEIVARLDYDMEHDIQEKKSDVLKLLFDCDVCGEWVRHDGISYLWFKKKEVK